MNPAHLDLFRAVLRHGGMTKAAAALGIGQPYVSRAVAQLEVELGFALFNRGHGSATATAEGEAFAREVDRTHAGLDHLRDAARQIREFGTGPLNVACQPSLAARLLPRAIRRLGLESPGARVALHAPSPDTIWSWAASGQIDLGIGRPRPGHVGVDSEPFLTVDAVCAVPCGHALAEVAAVTLRDLADQPLIAGAPGAFQRSVEAAFADAVVVPRFVHSAQYTVARCGLVAEGAGLAIVDPIPARQLGHLPVVLRPFKPRLPIESVLVRPAGRPPGRLAARLIDILKEERETVVADGQDDDTQRSTAPSR